MASGLGWLPKVAEAWLAPQCPAPSRSTPLLGLGHEAGPVQWHWDCPSRQPAGRCARIVQAGRPRPLSAGWPAACQHAHWWHPAAQRSRPSLARPCSVGDSSEAVSPEAAERRPAGPNEGGSAQNASADRAAEVQEGTPPMWSRPSAAEVITTYRWEVAHAGGRLVIQPLTQHHTPATVELLAVCFADSLDAGSLLNYIRNQIVKYLADQQRFFAKGQGVCLVALWYPGPSSDTPQPAEPILVGTVSLAFAIRSLPRFPTLNIPPHRTNAYLSNMAVQPTHRRRGVAKQLLAASEELAALLHKRALYLHVRFVDDVPQGVYTAAGYHVVARDTALSWLFLQRRRCLMRKQLHLRVVENGSLPWTQGTSTS